MHVLDVNTRNLKTQSRQGDTLAAGIGSLTDSGNGIQEKLGQISAPTDSHSEALRELAGSAAFSAGSAMSCIDEMLRPIFVAIQVMASQQGLSDKEKSKRLDDIARLAKSGLCIADDMTLTLDVAMDSFSSRLEDING